MTTARAGIVAVLFALAGAAAAQPVHSPWPGGIAIVPVAGEARPTVTVDGRPALVFRADGQWQAMIAALHYRLAPIGQLQVDRDSEAFAHPFDASDLTHQVTGFGNQESSWLDFQPHGMTE